MGSAKTQKALKEKWLIPMLTQNGDTESEYRLRSVSTELRTSQSYQDLSGGRQLTQYPRLRVNDEVAELLVYAV